jgi:DNA-binding FadR family transcriptional regulator
LEGSTVTTLSGLKERLSRDPLREQIAAGLAAQIEAGLLAPGEELPGERELAATLEVGRESVRAALQTLAARGMIEISHGSRCRVIGPTGLGSATLPKPARHGTDPPLAAVREARLALEPLLAGRAALRIGTATLGRLRRLVEAQAGMAEDPVRFQISDREFHLLLYGEAGNTILAGFAEQVYVSAYPMRWEVMRLSDGVVQAYGDHVAILAALEARDEAAAAAAMARHIEHIHDLAAAYGKEA